MDTQEEEFTLDSTLIFVFTTLIAYIFSMGYYILILFPPKPRDKLERFIQRFRIPITFVTILHSFLNSIALGFASDDPGIGALCIFFALLTVDSILHLIYFLRVKIPGRGSLYYLVIFSVCFILQTTFFCLNFPFEIFLHFFTIASKLMLVVKIIPTTLIIFQLMDAKNI